MPETVAPYFMVRFVVLGVALFLTSKALELPFVTSILKNITSTLSAIFGTVGSSVAGLFHWFIDRRQGARFMSPLERVLILNEFHRGFLMDGHKLRLSQKTSFQSVATVGGVGKGKSSTFVIPNLLKLDNCSMVVTDTSGEIYDQTSGHLKKKGFNIKVLNLMNIHQGLSYNPLVHANSFTEIQRVAHLIIRSSLPSEQEAFWSSGAEKIIKIMIQCLKNRGEEKYINLHNVKYLINHFDAHLHRNGKSKIDQFVVAHTHGDSNTFNEYKGFTNGNEKTMLSFLSTADTALSALGNPDLARFTSNHTIDFQNLRREKTVLYVMVKQQDLKFYSFLLNLFYTDLFNFLLSSLDSKNLPVYLMLDEFGHLTIPEFEVFATTARKYKVAFWIFLQSLSQLEIRYGRKEAETIMDGLQTEVYFSGLGIETTKMLEQRLGRVQIPVRRSGGTSWMETNLMNADRIIRMKDNQVLFLHSNLPPLKLKVKPFYKQWSMSRAAKQPPHPLPEILQSDPLECVPLEKQKKKEKEKEKEK